jgi:HNH endonuclease
MTVNKANEIIAQARKYKEEREKGYREQALKLFPWICGRCAREFNHKNLRELTVHHINHNHDHNPPDGSNWELLCLYCHDNEHQRFEEQVRYGDLQLAGGKAAAAAVFNPFADLRSLLDSSKK